MKKFLYIISLFMFATIFLGPMFQSAHAEAEAASDSSGECKFPWINCSYSIPDPDWSNVFGTEDPEKAGQDLYETIYNKLKANPQKKALKNTTGKYGVAEGEMQELLSGSYQPILKRSPKLSQEQAISKMLEIQRQFQEENDLLTFQAEIQAKVEPNELFANGDLGDSGFDLVNDLTNIENILFNKKTPIGVGGNFDPGDDSAAGGGVPSPASENSDDSGGGPSSQNPSSNNNGANPPAGAENQNPSPTQPPTSPKDDPNICFVPNGLSNALSQFEQDKKVDPRLRVNDKASAESLPDTVASPSGGQISPDLEFKSPKTPAAKGAPADSWLKEPPCNDVFCLKINFVKKPATSAYNDTDNCIACHIEKINDKLKETVKHSLIPNKTSGNALEPGVCKKAAGAQVSSVGLKFYLAFKPVTTPTNDDLIFGSSLAQEWEKFVNLYKPFKLPSKPDPAAAEEVPPSEADQATKAAIAYARPDATFDEVSKQADQQLILSAQNRNDEVAVAEASVDSDGISSFYQAIQKELDQMNSYFDIFQAIIHSLHEKVEGVQGDQACSELKDKQECE